MTPLFFSVAMNLFKIKKSLQFIYLQFFKRFISLFPSFTSMTKAPPKTAVVDLSLCLDAQTTYSTNANSELDLSFSKPKSITPRLSPNLAPNKHISCILDTSIPLTSRSIRESTTPGNERSGTFRRFSRSPTGNAKFGDSSFEYNSRYLQATSNRKMLE